MSFPTVTRKATRKVIAKAKKEGIDLKDKVPAIFLDEETDSPSGATNSKQATLQDLIDLFKAANLFLITAKASYYVEALIAAHLKDLQNALGANTVKEKKKANWRSRLQFILLAIAGTIFFGCEGFDGVSALLGVFNLPTVGIFIAGTTFSILSILVFYAFDLVEISNNLGVNLKSAPKMVDLYTGELESIKALRVKINSECADKKTVEELNEYRLLVKALQERRNQILTEVNKLEKALDNRALRVAKLVTAAITGVIFFSGGFFAGQTVALAIAGFAVSGISATFWPIILVSVLVGLAAFAVYWFVERPGIENLIGRIIGLDKEKIDKLTDVEETDRETKDMNALLEHINTKVTALGENSRLTQAYEEEIAGHNRDKEGYNKANLILQNEMVNLKIEIQDKQSDLNFYKRQHGDAVSDNSKLMRQLQETQEENKRLQSALSNEQKRSSQLQQVLTGHIALPMPSFFSQKTGWQIEAPFSKPDESKPSLGKVGFFSHNPDSLPVNQASEQQASNGKPSQGANHN